MKDTKQGFTLVELMVVVAIIGILAAVSIPMYTGMVAKSRSQEASRSLALFKSAQETYRATHFSYATTFEQLNIAGFTGGGSKATVGKEKGEYTITFEASSSTFNATATGYPLSPAKSDIWTISDTDSEPVHSVFGY